MGGNKSGKRREKGKQGTKGETQRVNKGEHKGKQREKRKKEKQMEKWERGKKKGEKKKRKQKEKKECTSDRKHGHANQLFSTQTQIQSQPNGQMCVHDDLRRMSLKQAFFHLTSRTPPRCGAKRTDAQRQEEHRKTGPVRSSVLSDHPCEPHT